MIYFHRSRRDHTNVYNRRTVGEKCQIFSQASCGGHVSGEKWNTFTNWAAAINYEIDITS